MRTIVNIMENKQIILKNRPKGFPDKTTWKLETVTIPELEEGEISLPLLDEDRSGLKKYKIIKINNRFEEHMADYSKDFIRIKELALKDKQLRAIEKWTKEKISDTYVSISKDYKYCDFTNNWSKN